MCGILQPVAIKGIRKKRQINSPREKRKRESELELWMRELVAKGERK